MKRLIFFVFAFFYVIYTNAQAITEKRIEFDLRNGYYNERIFESSKGFFVLESIADKDIDGKTEIKYDLYNGDLELAKTESVFLPKRFHKAGFYYNDNYIYNLYFITGNEFIINIIDMVTLDSKIITGKHTPKIIVESFAVYGNNAYCSAFYKKAKIVLKIDLSTGKETIVPVNIGTISPKKIKIENFQLIEKTGEVFLFAKARLSKSMQEFYMIKISDNETHNDVIKISSALDNSISSISADKIDNDKIIITGTYSKNGYTSEGLFFGELDDGTLSYMNYYNFLDLKDFLSYLPPKKQEKINKKKEKKEAQGKEMTLDYWIASHNIIELNDGYLFLGEAYYPTYRTETYTTYVNGVATTHYRTVFDGYQYTHATLGKFSKKGELMWDVCFELNPGYKPFSVRRFIAISDKTADQISMAYTSRNNIVSKTIDFNGKIISDKKWNYIETNNETDKLKRTYSSINHWYGNYFLAYGSQVIKSDNGKRKVYFINKIGF
jgi:hypothetical protein